MFRVLISVLIVYFSMSVSTQSNLLEKWRVVAYTDTTILIIMNDRLQTIEVPARTPFGNTDLALSPDNRYIIYSNSDDENTESQDSFNLGLFVFDRESSQTISVEHPVLADSDYLMIGSFNPDGSQFVAVTATTHDGYLLVVNVSDGSIETVGETTEIFSSETLNAPFMMNWNEDGILLYPHCYPCEGLTEGYAWLWQPASPDPSRETTTFYRIAFYSHFSDHLNGTGEILFSDTDDRFPTAGFGGLSYNVVRYLDSPTKGIDDAPIVYVNSTDTPGVPVPRWVADGRAFIVHGVDQPMATLIWRNGTEETIELGEPRAFLAGTPDGWLMHDEEQIYHLVLTAEGLVEQIVLPADDLPILDTVVVAEQPALGRSNLEPLIIPDISEE